MLKSLSSDSTLGEMVNAMRGETIKSVALPQRDQIVLIMNSGCSLIIETSPDSGEFLFKAVDVDETREMVQSEREHLTQMLAALTEAQA